MKLICKHPEEWRVRRLGIVVCLQCDVVMDANPPPVECDDPDCPGFFVEPTMFRGEEWWLVQRCDHCAQYGSDEAAAIMNFESAISQFHGVSCCPSCTVVAKIPKTEAARRMVEAEDVDGLEERHDVLCQCGWGLVNVPVSIVDPENLTCPMCGYVFGKEAM